MEHITKNTFERLVLKSEKPVVLDFWATWCGPCQMMAPVLEELQRERPDLLVGKIDVDQEMELAMQFQVASIPTILLIKDGKVVGRTVGYMSREELCGALGL